MKRSFWSTKPVPQYSVPTEKVTLTRPFLRRAKSPSFADAHSATALLKATLARPLPLKAQQPSFAIAHSVGALLVLAAWSSTIAARPIITPRDLAVLRWCGEQYGATQAHLACLLGRYNGTSPVSDSAVRQQTNRWQQLGLVRIARPLGATWVTLTRPGYDLVGLRHPVWKAPASRLAHCDAVNRVRLWYESSAARVTESGPWTSERALFAQRGRETWHVADAELRTAPTQGATAIEVELTIKQPGSRYITEVFDRLRPPVETVLYLSPPPLVAPLRTRLAWAQERAGLLDAVSVVVRSLPEAASGQSARSL